jgi:hypothetical protein
MHIAHIDSPTQKSVREAMQPAPARRALGRRETLTDWLVVVIAILGTVLSVFFEWP